MVIWTKFFLGINSSTPFSNGQIPEYVFITHQMMFAIITPALITGAFTGRVTFKAYLIFLALWQILVYYPFVHMIWGGGILQQLGILDFAGFVPVWAAAIIGIVASIVSYAAVELKNKRRGDDALDVWGVHGVGGFTGTVLPGVFASKVLNESGANGLIYGGTSFFFKQLLVSVLAAVYAFLFTYVMLWLINKITHVRVTEEEERLGLNSSIHEEEAYT